MELEIKMALNILLLFCMEKTGTKPPLSRLVPCRVCRGVKK